MTPPAESNNARLLVISYHFGSAGSTGGFRWAAHARGLAALGWSIDVVTSDEPSGESLGNVRVHCVPRVVWPIRASAALASPLRALARSMRRKPSVEPNAVVSVSNEDRLALLRKQADALPIWRRDVQQTTSSQLLHAYDELQHIVAWIHWARRAARVGARLVRAHSHRLVLVSSPPHVTQLAGHWLAKREGIDYVGDYRDPWAMGVPELDSEGSLVRPIYRFLERRVQCSARLVIHNTAHARARATQQPGMPKVPRASIANGYDDELDAATPDRESFRILVAGHIYPFMDPRTLMRAVQRLRDQSNAMANRIRLEFLGAPSTLAGMSLRDLAIGLGVHDCTTITPRVSRGEAILAQQRAAVLVAFDYPHPLAVPMKVYDYLRTRGAILGFTAGDSALAAVLRGVGAQPVAPDDVDHAVEVLRLAFDRWSAGEIAAPNDTRGDFSRQRQTERLDLLLRRTLAGATDPTASLET